MAKRRKRFGKSGKPPRGGKNGKKDSDAEDEEDADAEDDEDEEEEDEDEDPEAEEGSAEADAKGGRGSEIDPSTGKKEKKKTKKTGAAIGGGNSPIPVMCELGKVLSEKDGAYGCIRMPKNPLNCYRDADGDCTSCRDGLFLQNGTCAWCEEKCFKCDIDKCTECKDSYVLANGMCRSCRLTELYDSSTKTCIPRKNVSGLKAKLKSKTGKVRARTQNRKKKFSVPKIKALPKSAAETKDANGKPVKLFAFAEYKIKTTVPPEAMVIRNQVNGGKNLKGSGLKPKKCKKDKKTGKKKCIKSKELKKKGKSINDDKEVDVKDKTVKGIEDKDGEIKNGAKDIRKWPAKRQLDNFRKKFVAAEKAYNAGKKNQDTFKINVAKFELKQVNTLVVNAKRKAINELEDAEDDYDKAKKKGDKGLEEKAKLGAINKKKLFEETKRQCKLSLKKLDEVKIAPAKGDVEEDPKEARKAPAVPPKQQQKIEESKNSMIKARKDLEELMRKGTEDDLSETQQNLNEAKEVLQEAERNGTNKTIKRAKKKLLKAENALQRDMQVGESKSKKRESSYQLVKSQKKEKTAEIKETKKMFRDSAEKFADRKIAERKELAKILVGDVVKAEKLFKKIQKTGKSGEIKAAQGKLKEALFASEKASKKNIKGPIGDKRSMQQAIKKLDAATLAISKLKAVKEDYKEDINVIKDDIKNQDLLVTRRADELKKLILETKGP